MITLAIIGAFAVAAICLRAYSRTQKSALSGDFMERPEHFGEMAYYKRPMEMRDE